MIPPSVTVPAPLIPTRPLPAMIELIVAVLPLPTLIDIVAELVFSVPPWIV
ncbi:hypothetical protein DP49_5702 [Burkholderia pseudomallei]|nr:hypothetical protein DP49_5702 [Burkholderia pseudomallei]